MTTKFRKLEDKKVLKTKLIKHTNKKKLLRDFVYVLTSISLLETRL